jgi:hypothetical protein
MVIVLLSVCIAVAVVVYVRGRHPKGTTRTPRSEASTPNEAPGQTRHEVEGLSANSEGKDTNALEGGYSPQAPDNYPAQVPSDGSEAASEERDIVPTDRESPVVELGEGGPTGQQIKKSFEKCRRVSPKKRGGRPRMGTTETEHEETRKCRLRTFKPEIVCWKREREWILAVEVPDEQRGEQGISVLQNGTPLAEDKLQEGRWCLREACGEILIRRLGSDGEDKLTVMLSVDNHLLFKLSGASLNQGRRVKQPSSGSYLVVVPDGLERDEERAGTAPAAPESVCLAGYQAHFFDLADRYTCKISFRDRSGKPLEIGSRGPRFHLVGQQIHDANDTLGPLFRGSPPRMRVSEGSWESVGTIVVGEEGRGKGKWRTSFQANPDLPEQGMPGEIVSNKAGWYFVRFYDVQDELIDSLDFRFAAGLRGIVQPRNPFPSAAGHGVATVEFQHDADWCITRSSMSHEGVKVEIEGEKTILTIPPVAECDLTGWSLGPCGGPNVDVTTLVERIWWAVSSIKEPPLQWQDACLSFLPDDFAATSEKAVWLRFPKPRWTDQVFVGFQKTKRREYALKVQESTIAVPLRDFSDSQELADGTRDYSLRVWVTVNGAFYEAAVATVRAEMMEGTLDIARISPCRLARFLTTLHGVTSGPLRQLLKEVRRRYRRPRRAPAGRNTEFVKEALCTVAVFLQLAEDGQSVTPKSASRWRSKARVAGREFPETMRQIWRRYRELARTR